MRTTRDTELTALKKSNGKSYTILREYLCPPTEPNGSGWQPPFAGNVVVEYQALNPKTGEPWQAIRRALKSDFIFPTVEATVTLMANRDESGIP